MAFFILVATLPAAQAQQFYIDMRATVQQEDGGFVSMEHVTAPLFEDAFYVSTVRSLPPPDGSVLIESVSEASLISGRLHLRNSCAYPSLSQTCSGRAHWKDRLTYDLTGLPAGPVLVDVAATVSGTYGAALSTGFTVFAQSADQFAVIDTLRADVSFWRSFTTTTADPLGFTLLNSNGTWSTLGPEFYVGQLELAGGTVNTVNVEMLFNADTNQDLTGTFAISTAQGVPFTSSSGVFLSDLDGDGIVNSADNCTEHANPSQTDTDGDNFGNRCDPDLNNDGIVNFAD
ncbi:MAG: hypothetical protein HKN49_13720, partial [Gammaproteobacteria bacterium]|nr:hypothetical protein [Gammaproteobacteria bacterium]